MSDSNINPMYHVYEFFTQLVENCEIKYDYLAEQYETTEIQRNADNYIDALLEKDSFESYVDYTYEELLEVGITDNKIISQALMGNTSLIPEKYHEPLLLNRRETILNTYEEQNNYYRKYNGLPDLEDKKFYYVTDEISDLYNIDRSIPIHLIQDYYNNESPGYGDQIITFIEGTGYINALAKAHPEKEYLKFLGSNRVPILRLRQSKNFQIIKIDRETVKNNIYDQFIQLYNQSRDYFVSVVYIRTFREFIDYYDRFIAMCIMVMTIQQLVVKQIQLTVNREFFDVYAVRMLYQNYGVPFNLYLDDDTQGRIAKNLNIILQEKATDKCLYDIAAVLGFGSNFNIYKYYLSKQHKTDAYGVPKFATKEYFDPDDGEVKIIPDYEYMYDVYFHRAELKDDHFVDTFNSSLNTSDYNEVTDPDPFWWKDTNLYKKIYEAEYNFVESKYLSLSISYKMTDIMMDNIVLLKLIMQKSIEKNYSHFERSIPRKVSSLRVVPDDLPEEEYDRTRMIYYSEIVKYIPDIELNEFVHWVKSYKSELSDVNVQLPKITGTAQPVPVFDAIIALICLTACRHNLTGEIVTIPTQIIQVLDYIQNTEAGQANLVDSFAFDFDYFNPDNHQGKKDLEKIYILLTDEEKEKIQGYLSILSLDGYSGEEKIRKLNEMFLNIKNLRKYISYLMTKTKDRELYTRLREFMYAVYYSKEMKDMFTIIGKETGFERTALNFFEYLHYRNPNLYDAMFDFDINKAYDDYRVLINDLTNGKDHFKNYATDGNERPTCVENGLVSIYCEWQKEDGTYRTKEEMVSYILDNFKKNRAEFVGYVESGVIYCHYDVLKDVIVDNTDTKNEKIYYYANHIIYKLESLIDNLNYVALLGDSTAPLEDLLFKLCMFFKSYTTEIISMDKIYVCDLVPENMFRLFDEIAYIEKLIGPKDRMFFAYSDIIRALVRIWIEDKGFGNDLSMKEKWIKIIWLYIDRHPWVLNIIPLRDELPYMDKEINPEDILVRFYDILSTSVNSSVSDHLTNLAKKFLEEYEVRANIYHNESKLLKDKIYDMYYTDD